ncbi:hypothetical protein BDQ17DRAFT_1428105 [Cyathus striatus]|nr:hypothetical protein BDQ17DRAFT_1428105 [Cyathus striatus]
MPLNDAYKPDPQRWVRTCPSFLVSRFLLCKHLVQSVYQVPAVFLAQVKRRRTTPFWKHESLRVIEDTDSDDDYEDPAVRPQRLVPKIENNAGFSSDTEIIDGNKGSSDDDEEDAYNEQEIDLERTGKTFEESMNSMINTTSEFTDLLQYQIQFQDQQAL